MRHGEQILGLFQAFLVAVDGEAGGADVAAAVDEDAEPGLGDQGGEGALGGEATAAALGDGNPGAVIAEGFGDDVDTADFGDRHKAGSVTGGGNGWRFGSCEVCFGGAGPRVGGRTGWGLWYINYEIKMIFWSRNDRIAAVS